MNIPNKKNTPVDYHLLKDMQVSYETIRKEDTTWLIG